MDGEPIVQQVCQPSESLRRRAVRLRNHVEGEIEDEDGDAANGFILADPIPSPYIRSLYADNRRSSSSRRKHKLENKDPQNDGCRKCAEAQSSSSRSSESGWFSCTLCKCKFSLEELAFPVSNCSCLFCKSCFKNYVTSTMTEFLKAVNPKRSRLDVVDLTSDDDEHDEHCDEYHDYDDHDHDHDDDDDDEHDHIHEHDEAGADWIPCPSPFCDGRFTFTDLQSVAPDTFAEWEAAASEAFVENSGSFVRCPGCHVVIEKVETDLPPGLALSGVPEVDRTVPFTEVDDEGRRLSRRAMLDKAMNRFRCVMCGKDFCAGCLQCPYHLGKTCEEVEQEKLAVRCVYCDEVFRHRLKSLQAEVVTGSVKELRRELEVQGADSGWCVEKRDLVAVKRLCDRVCDKKECRSRLKDACTRSLHCGHRCYGVRGERRCLPCLEEGCRKASVLKGTVLPSADEYCGICMVESIGAAPSILMNCGHIVHWDCAKQQLQEGYPGPHISFGYLKCPQCKVVMQHSHLNPYLQKHLAMMEEIQKKAIKRMKHERVYEKLKISEEKRAAYAVEQYQYYMCSKCNVPYYGGKRNCGANLQEERRRYDPCDLVCGGCSAAGCAGGKCKQGHGKEYIEFKCRYCCSMATFFCFGTTHFCDLCHSLWPKLPAPLPQCRGSRECPLGAKHAPNGQEHCLGCSMCRSQEQL